MFFKKKTEPEWQTKWECQKCGAHNTTSTTKEEIGNLRDTASRLLTENIELHRRLGVS